MNTVYYSDEKIIIRSMKPEDCQIFYDTYLSYDWHPDIKTYENYYKEQEEGQRRVFIAEYDGEVCGICTLVLNPTHGHERRKHSQYQCHIHKRLSQFETHTGHGIGHRQHKKGRNNAGKYRHDECIGKPPGKI